MAAENEKPLLSIDEQIAHMQRQGIKFDICSVDEAKDYLANHNNYFRTRSYRTGFLRHESGINNGKFISLDFAALKGLASIDESLRYTLLLMALDIEHQVKMLILKAVHESGEDGYLIVQDYLMEKSSDSKSSLSKEISVYGKSIYCDGALERYKENPPIWVFLEFLSFGKLTYFSQFVAKRCSDKILEEVYYHLLAIRLLRNACAHSSCVINDLKSHSAGHRTRSTVSQALIEIGMGHKMRTRRMANERIRQIATLLFTHQLLIKDGASRKRVQIQLHKVYTEINQREALYSHNPPTQAFFDFFGILVDEWY